MEQHNSKTVRVFSLALTLLLVTAALWYAWHERTNAVRLTTENRQVSAALDQTRNEVAALSAKLDSMSNALPTHITVGPEPAKPSPVVRHGRPSARRSARPVQRDDPRWKQFQEQLARQGTQIDATRQDLDSARTELQGSIARTHDELVVLQRKGERNYFEFDVNKSKQFQRTGPIGVRLRKANVKHQYADLELLVDDVSLTKKHVNLLEPVMFYAADNGQPIELVINGVSKNHIRGYVSQPKYRRSELAAMASGSQGATNPPETQSSSTAPALKARQRLPQP